MAIEIVDFPMKNGGSFHCYVSSPEGSGYINHQLGIIIPRPKTPTWTARVSPCWTAFASPDAPVALALF